jgi:DNA end-binding protein Ku
MASSLVDNMSADFSPDKFSDEYQDQLRQLIAAKLEKGDALDTAATFGEQEEDEADRGDVVDLMEALRRSVEQNRATGKATETKPTAKKAAARKASARRRRLRRHCQRAPPRRQRQRSQPRKPVDTS